MPRCPNCGYILVLLEKRRRYKCAKCGRVYLKKEIENKKFREWNKKQRRNDIEDFEKEIEKEKRRKYKAKIMRPFKRLEKSKYKPSPEERRAIRLAQKREYNRKNKAKLKKWYTDLTNRKKLLVAQQKYRQLNKERVQMNKRLCYWRMKQCEMVEEVLMINKFMMK